MCFKVKAENIFIISQLSLLNWFPRTYHQSEHFEDAIPPLTFGYLHFN